MKPVEFVAEIASNHNQDLDRCIEFVDIAAEVGCDAVKFQLFKVDQLFAPQILERSETHRSRKAWELPFEFIPVLAERARAKGLKFSCTPFYLDAVEELLPYVDFFKIASYELLWLDLIAACGKTGKPLVLSTGMATMDEISSAVECFGHSGGEGLTLLHCVSHYPAAAEECNLTVIDTLRKQFLCDVGWSDHSVSTAVVNRAVHHCNATMVEFHLDIEGHGAEFEAGHCWLPDKIRDLIGDIRLGLLADGNGIKVPAESEQAERPWRADPVDGLRPLKSIRES